eukprot:16451682-Heterocapsa_arctica.AAC.1
MEQRGRQPFVCLSRIDIAKDSHHQRARGLSVVICPRSHYLQERQALPHDDRDEQRWFAANADVWQIVWKQL